MKIRTYLDYYYTNTQDPENIALADFCVELVHYKFPFYGDILDYGFGGMLIPTLALGMFSWNVNLTDINPEAEQEFKLWKNKNPTAFNWQPWIDYLRGKGIRLSESQLREKASFIYSDVTHFEPFDFLFSYNIVTSFFCLETAAKNEKEYADYLKLLIGKTVRNGKFGFGAILDAQYWEDGTETKKCFPITEAFFRAQFDEYPVKEFTVVPASIDRGYKALIFCKGIKC